MSAQYKLAFPIVINAERLVITDTAGDMGGLSVAGISIVHWPKHKIFAKVKELGLKAGQWHADLTPIVYDFYKENFWDAISGDHINDQEVANTMFSQSLVNGIKPAIKDMQLASGATEEEADGIMGPKTIELINNPKV
jgi:lysozyme family protein